jgi:hypothetical protein
VEDGMNFFLTILAFFALGCGVNGEGFPAAPNANAGDAGSPRRGPAQVDSGTELRDVQAQIDAVDLGSADVRVVLVEAGAEDARTAAVEAGTVEAGTVEAGTVEAGTVEAGTVEAGTVEAGTDSGAGYTDAGVTAHLGVNLCTAYYASRGEDAGWLPVAGANGTCYPNEGVCGSRPACGAYAPGTLLVWDATDVRYRYLGDPSGGYVCLPNNIVYTVTCN